MGDTNLSATAKTLFDLPVEDIMVMNVAKYLDIEDLFALRKCSEYCEVLADQMLGGLKFAVLDFQRWKRLKPNTDKSVQDILILISTNSRCLRELIFNNIKSLPEVVLFNFLDKNSNLRQIEISHCTIKPSKPFALLPTLAQCKNIIKLTIERSNGYFNFLNILCKHNNHVLEFNCTMCTVMDSRDVQILKTFFEKQPHMESITFALSSVTKTYFREILQTIAETCRGLKYLICKNDWVIDDEIIE